ncbi:hypothetical protein B0H17DRAFT_235393 [Mycena rosella]|uniref:Mitochondrial ribosomal protein S15 n=1 Tax=Mycena rosella TaxID=1033263 RepID=A0AAD7H0Z0_MYCRO|nr:hypothetical protein B0H17DRAFT_235393 [Mycena rosella]
MLRACASQPCRLASVASTSSSAFHTSVALSKISEAHIRARAIKKANLEEKRAREARLKENRPSVILGTRPGEDDKWLSSYLGRLVVDESVFAKPPSETVQPRYGVDMPEYKAFGVAEAEEKKLFRDLHKLSSDFFQNEEKEKVKAANFARVIDLRNADAGGIAYENRRRIIEAFSTPENPFDPGRTEVQAAILTYRIHKLYAHLTRCKHDVQNKLSLRKLVHHRARVLKYLKQTQRVRYDILLERLALEPEAVEGELVVN